ncbi:MAG: hypothetical protein IKA00_04035 [Prevotella sp.]|nr:hypothetical protein [Prevotella sp.]MBR3858492.1 hypothetical protein [Bacteroidaceae bacterium]
MDNERKQQLTVSKDELIPYIKDQGIKLAEKLVDARKKFGHRYNEKNKAEEMIRRFGDPRSCPERFADEYFLLRAKTSQLPASIRDIVREVCDAAYVNCFYDKLRKVREQEAAQAAAQPNPKKSAKKRTTTIKTKTEKK